MASKTKIPNSGGVGGAANEAGSEFRGRVATWLITHALAGRRIEALDMPSGMDVPTGLLLPESDAAVDDIQAGLAQGATLYIQAKRTLSLSKDPNSEFGKAARQLATQAASTGFTPKRTRLAIVVGKSTGPLRALSDGLRRRRCAIAGAPSNDEAGAVAALVSHWQHLDAAQIESLLDVSVVLILDLDTPESPAREAAIAHLGARVEGGVGETAWKLLESHVRLLAARRLGGDMHAWLDALSRAGVVVRSDPSAGPDRKSLVALDLYKKGLIAAGRRVSLQPLQADAPAFEVEPTTFDVPASNGQAEVGLSWLVRRRRRVLLLGLPGIGKSTALRRLAAECSALTNGPLPVSVFLPRFGDVLAEGGNSLEALVDVGTAHVPSDDLAHVRGELLRELRSGGRAILILDSLDECRQRRHAVVDGIRTALLELHDDVEVVLASRDTAYSNAATLGLSEATLQSPHDLATTLHRFAAHLAEAAGIPPAERDAWARRVLAAVRQRHGSAGAFRQTPLAAVGLVILAVEHGVEAAGPARSASLSALVDWIAKRWEIDERRRGDVEISTQLSRHEAQDFVTDAFNVIAHEFDGVESLKRSILAERVAGWAALAWGLPSRRAQSAAAAALDFWDDAGVFVATSPEEVVRPREAALRDVGIARWLVSQATPLERTAWIDANVGELDRREPLRILVGLHAPSAAALVAHAASRHDRSLSMFTAGAVAEGPRDDPTTWRPIVRQLVAVLMPHLLEGGRDGWAAFEAMLDLPLDREDVAIVLGGGLKTFDTVRSNLAAALGRLVWEGQLDRAEALGVLTNGPPKAWPRNPTSTGFDPDSMGVDCLYSKLAIELAAGATPDDTELVCALARERRVSSGASLEVMSHLRQNGCSAMVERARDPNDIYVHASASRIWERSSTAHLNLLKFATGLGDKRASYGDRRRMRELADFLESALPGETLVPDFEVVLCEHEALSCATLDVVAQLGGFDRDTISGSAAALFEDGLIDDDIRNIRHIWLHFEARERELLLWPGEGADELEMLNSAVRLFTGTMWTAGVASRALLHR